MGSLRFYKSKLHMEKTMKSRNFIIAVLMSVLVCVCILQSNGVAKSGKDIEAVKVAVVNVERLLIDGEKNKKFEESFSADLEKTRAELNVLEEEIADAKELMAKLKPTSDDFAKRGRALMEKEISLEIKKKYVQQELLMRRQRWLEFSFRSIIKEAEKVAKAEGYDMVLAKDGYHWPAASLNDLMSVIQTSKVLYNSEEMDITDKVLAAWNAVKLD